MLDARNVYRKVTRKIYDFTPEQHANLAAIVWLYRGQKERFLGLVKEYLGRPSGSAASGSLVHYARPSPRSLSPPRCSSECASERAPLLRELIRAGRRGPFMLRGVERGRPASRANRRTLPAEAAPRRHPRGLDAFATA